MRSPTSPYVPFDFNKPPHATERELMDIHFFLKTLSRSYHKNYLPFIREVWKQPWPKQHIHLIKGELLRTGERARWIIISMREMPYPFHLEKVSKSAFRGKHSGWQVTPGLPPELKHAILQSETVGIGMFEPVNLSLKCTGTCRISGLEWTILLVGDIF